MNAQEYIEKIEDIRKSEFMSLADMSRELNITYPTLSRIKIFPEKASPGTMKKIKRFVDMWMDKNKDGTWNK